MDPKRSTRRTLLHFSMFSPIWYCFRSICVIMLLCIHIVMRSLCTLTAGTAEENDEKELF